MNQPLQPPKNPSGSDASAPESEDVVHTETFVIAVPVMTATLTGEEGRLETAAPTFADRLQTWWAGGDYVPGPDDDEEEEA
jgi:hypothetical protein